VRRWRGESTFEAYDEGGSAQRGCSIPRAAAEQGFVRFRVALVGLLVAASTTWVVAAESAPVAPSHSSAIDALEAAVRAAPSDAAAHFRLGEAWVAQGGPEQARLAYRKAAALDPGGLTGLRAWQRLQTLPPESFRDCEDCPELLSVPPGRFAMGSEPTEEGRFENEGPPREVTIPQPLAVGRFEVTVREWRACVQAGACPPTASKARPGDDHPVVGIDWNATQRYVGWLSKRTGHRYRLLSESEWEYVTRSGSTAARFWGERDLRTCEFANVANLVPVPVNPDDPATNLIDCNDGWLETAPVGRFKANAFGLHDTLGNVWEWVQDCYREDGWRDAPHDGSAHVWRDCERRVVRGGSWFFVRGLVRSAMRAGQASGAREDDLGLRVVRALSGAPTAAGESPVAEAVPVGAGIATPAPAGPKVSGAAPNPASRPTAGRESRRPKQRVNP
jgi:formylglycine-generating enzyme required for sulfatase activity